MKTIVYIDGENLIHQLVEVLKVEKVIKDRSELVYFRLRKLLESSLEDLGEINEIRYYGTKLREYKFDSDVQNRSLKKIAWSAKWSNVLQRDSIKYVKSGVLKVRDGEECRSCKQVRSVFQEKGVDVRIATDIVFEAIAADVDRIVLVSSDTDLLPALERVKDKVEIIYLTHEAKITRAITQVAHKTRTYTSAAVTDSFKAGQPKLGIEGGDL